MQLENINTTIVNYDASESTYTTVAINDDEPEDMVDYVFVINYNTNSIIHQE